MKRFVITEEERNTILNQYKKYMLNEQEQTTITTTLPPAQQPAAQTTTPPMTVSNTPLSTIRTTGLQLAPNLGGQQVTDKMGTRNQQPMTVQAQTEYQKSQAELDADWKNQEEKVAQAQKISREQNIDYNTAWEIVNGIRQMPQTQQQGYQTGVNFPTTSAYEIGAGVGRLLNQDNTSSDLYNIIKVKEMSYDSQGKGIETESSKLIVPAPEVSDATPENVANYDKVVNDYLTKYNVNLKLNWVPHYFQNNQRIDCPNKTCGNGMKSGRFEREGSPQSGSVLAQGTTAPANSQTSSTTTPGAAQTASTTTPGAAQTAGATQSTVASIQDFLETKGYKNLGKNAQGQSDGILGTKTLQAIEGMLNKTS